MPRCASGWPAQLEAAFLSPWPGTLLPDVHSHRKSKMEQNGCELFLTPGPARGAGTKS